MIHVPGYKVGGILLTEEEIQKRIRELGKQISGDYAGEDIFVVGVLKGSFIFMADLVRALEGDVSMDFLVASSYGDSTETSGSVEIRKDLDRSPAGKNVLIVEDIIDSGVTLKYLKDFYFAGKGAKSVKIATLLDKPARRRTDVVPDYCGFSVDDRFIIGYGLDYAEQFRQLPHITYLIPEEEQ
ncbi:MAG: hypoxanthine phosphoribosyltransferase [Anaerovoracaceae bacterium]